jgi:hypothetical protein
MGEMDHFFSQCQYNNDKQYVHAEFNNAKRLTGHIGISIIS